MILIEGGAGSSLPTVMNTQMYPFVDTIPDGEHPERASVHIASKRSQSWHLFVLLHCWVDALEGERGEVLALVALVSVLKPKQL
jgi:hypothetical protein